MHVVLFILAQPIKQLSSSQVPAPSLSQKLQFGAQDLQNPFESDVYDIEHRMQKLILKSQRTQLLSVHFKQLLSIKLKPNRQRMHVISYCVLFTSQPVSGSVEETIIIDLLQQRQFDGQKQHDDPFKKQPISHARQAVDEHTEQPNPHNR